MRHLHVHGEIAITTCMLYGNLILGFGIRGHRQTERQTDRHPNTSQPTSTPAERYAVIQGSCYWFKPQQQQQLFFVFFMAKSWLPRMQSVRAPGERALATAPPHAGDRSVRSKAVCSASCFR